MEVSSQLQAPTALHSRDRAFSKYSLSTNDTAISLILYHYHTILFRATVVLRTYLLCGTTSLVELWPPHILYVRFRDNEFLQDGVVSPTPNPQPGGPGYLS
jgi:hypothetical protein